MCKTILYVDPGHAFGLKKRTHPFYAKDFDIVDQYSFAKTDLSGYRCISIPGFIDQEYMQTQRDKILEFLHDGKILIFCGHLFRDWIPGASMFIPKKINSFQDYAVHIQKNHMIFKGVKEDDMSYNKGVAGFFARGFYQPPKQAEILLTLGENEVVTYIDQNTTNGIILLHAGNDLFSYMQANKTTDRISTQTFAWVQAAYDQRQKERVSN